MNIRNNLLTLQFSTVMKKNKAIGNHIYNQIQHHQRLSSIILRDPFDYI